MATGFSLELDSAVRFADVLGKHVRALPEPGVLGPQYLASVVAAVRAVAGDARQGSVADWHGSGSSRAHVFDKLLDGVGRVSDAVATPGRWAVVGGMDRVCDSGFDRGVESSVAGLGVAGCDATENGSTFGSSVPVGGSRSVGDDGGSDAEGSVSRGRHWKRNANKRAARRRRAQGGLSGGDGDGGGSAGVGGPLGSVVHAELRPSVDGGARGGLARRGDDSGVESGGVGAGGAEGASVPVVAARGGSGTSGASRVPVGRGLPRGPNFARNQANREKRKRSKIARAMLAPCNSSRDWRSTAGPLGSGSERGCRIDAGLGSGFVPDTSSCGGAGDSVPPAVHSSADSETAALLRSTLDARRIAENRLAEAYALRRLAVLDANDVDSEIRRYRTRVNAMTEQNMVSIEKTHAKLRATGNVPGVPGGYAETVSGSGSLSSGTISPNSSASMAEFHAVQKELSDLKLRAEKMEKVIRNCNLDPALVDDYTKSVWTDCEETYQRLDEIYVGYTLQPFEAGSDKLRLVAN